MNPYVMELENRLRVLENKLKELANPPPPPPPPPMSSNEEFYKETIRALIQKLSPPSIQHQ